MKALLSLLSIASALVAQSPNSAAANGLQTVIDSIVAGKPLQLAPRTPYVGATIVAAPTSTCSVPLLKMRIPADQHFTMQVVQPPSDKIDRIQAIAPAPVCPDPPQ
jgi:hypothetical protein